MYSLSNKPPVKKVIKLSQSQLQDLLRAAKPSRTMTAASPQTSHLTTSSPLTPKKMCGLFDEDILLDIDETGITEDTTFITTTKMDSMLSQSDRIDASNEISFNLGETQSKFMRKLKSLNMKIQVPPAPCSLEKPGCASVFDLQLTEDEWTKLIDISDEVVQMSNDDQTLENFGCDTAAIEKVLLDGGLFNQGDDAFMPQQQSDHVYSKETTPRKRTSSVLLEDSLDSSFNSNSTSRTLAKKHRPRGIYRLDDVTNEEELENYLERRKKNNISSKASRAHKKSLYNEMDAKSDAMVTENDRLRAKIVKMEELSKIVKNMLIEKIAGK